MHVHYAKHVLIQLQKQHAGFYEITRQLPTDVFLEMSSTAINQIL